MLKKRYASEIIIPALLMISALVSYYGSSNSIVGRDEKEILHMAINTNNYEVAQRIYENNLTRHTISNVLGVTNEIPDIELMIYPEKRLKAEINRLESLLAKYPTYPTLLTQLAKLNRAINNHEKAQEYEQELVRLNFVH